MWARTQTVRNYCYKTYTYVESRRKYYESETVKLLVFDNDRYEKRNTSARVTVNNIHVYIYVPITKRLQYYNILMCLTAHRFEEGRKKNGPAVLIPTAGLTRRCRRRHAANAIITTIVPVTWEMTFYLCVRHAYRNVMTIHFEVWDFLSYNYTSYNEVIKSAVNRVITHYYTIWGYIY